MTNEKARYDPEERFIQFALLIINFVEILPNTRVGNHIAGQLLRSGTGHAFNYGETQVAESREFLKFIKLSPLRKVKNTKNATKTVE